MINDVTHALRVVADLFATGAPKNAEDVGMGHFMLCFDHVRMNDYSACVNAYLARGFVFFASNGPCGLQSSVFTTSLQNAALTVTVTFLPRISKIYVTAAEDQPLSGHLVEDQSGEDGIPLEGNTRLHMLEMYENGNSFLIQLKNGHFVMNDGGLPADLPYFLDYLESLVPEGERPVIEAWMFSHAHSDHVGLLKGFLQAPAELERVRVEGVYLNHPNHTIVETLDAKREDQWLKDGLPILKNSHGVTPPVYRLQTGQRYFFCDVTMDVVHTQEQLPLEEYSATDGYNDTSTWLMYTIEGQKLLLTGDADIGSIRKILEVYPPEFWKLNLYAVPHHGINVEQIFNSVCQVDTVLYTGWWGRMDVPIRPDNCRREENLSLQSQAREFMTWGDGTKVFTFPYHPGEVLRLPMQQWCYHQGHLEKILKDRRFL